MKFEVYTDKKGEWRWRLKASNGQTVATPGEGFSSKTACMNNIDIVKKAGDAEVVEV